MFSFFVSLIRACRFYGVFDWASEGESDDDIRFRRFLSSVITRVPPDQDPDQFKHASPCYWFSENRSRIKFPVLLIHGKSDSIAGGLSQLGLFVSLLIWSFFC